MAKKKNLKQKLQEAKKEVESVSTETKSNVKEVISSSENSGMLFHKDNYILMGAGLLIILIGFMLMAGGKHPDPNVFDKEALFSFRRITLAPLLVLIGFAVEGYAILKKPSTK